MVDCCGNDAAGNVYGTTAIAGANSNGAVFRLTYTGNGWTYTSFHDVTGGSDGGTPLAGVTIDRGGNLYLTTSAGGSGYGCAPSELNAAQSLVAPSHYVVFCFKFPR